MNLRELVVRKVEELGDKAAAEYFGKTVQTVQTWKKNAPIPMAAAQKVLDDGIPEPAVPEQPARQDSDARFDAAFAAIDQLRERIDYIDSFLQQQFNNGQQPVDGELPPLIPNEDNRSMVNPMATVVPNNVNTTTRRIGPLPPAGSRVPPATIPSQAGAWNTPHKKK